MIEQQEFHWPHVDASRELLWQVTGVVVSKQTRQRSSPGIQSSQSIHISWFLDDKSTWPLTHVYDPLIHHFVLLGLTWFDHFWSSFARKKQLHFCRTGRFSSFCLVRHLHHHLVWCKSEHAWKQYDFSQGGGSTSDPKQEAQANPRPSSQHKLGNILKNKTQQNTPWTNDGKQNKPSSYIVILSPEWWL